MAETEHRMLIVNGRKIAAHYWLKPMPCRDLDWQAVLDNYDGGDSEPIGFGATLMAAVADLLDQLEDGQ